MPFRTSFYLGSTLTYDVLKVMFGGVKQVNSKRYEYLSDLKAIEIQYDCSKRNSLQFGNQSTPFVVV